MNQNGVNINIIYKIIASVITSLVLLSSIYFIYQHFSLSEEDAKNASDRFFNMLIMKNRSSKEFEDIYPNFNEIGSRVVPAKKCEITNLSKNSDGEYEVYSYIEISNNNSIPIYLLIGKSNGKLIIKSSKGINYAYYNRVLEYGKKKGCLTGNENDVEMGKIIKDKNLLSYLELETKFKMDDIYSNLKISNDIKSEFGMITGNVSIKNFNPFDLDYGDIECTIEFYSRNGNIVSTDKIYLLDGIRANGSTSSSVFSNTGNASSFKIIPVVKNTDALKNKIRDRIISETDFGCK